MMSKRQFGPISVVFLGMVLLLAVVFSAVISNSSQAEFVALTDETMASLFGGACSGNTGSICTRGNKVQDWKGEFINCTNCATGEKSFKPEIWTCNYCANGDTKYVKVRNLCVETKSKCSTHGFPPPEEGKKAQEFVNCRYHSWCNSKNKPPRRDDCGSLKTPVETCS